MANREQSEDWSNSLEALLSDSAGKLAFAAFLQDEYAIENLNFLMAANRFSKITSLIESKGTFSETLHHIIINVFFIRLRRATDFKIYWRKIRNTNKPVGRCRSRHISVHNFFCIFFYNLTFTIGLLKMAMLAKSCLLKPKVRFAICYDSIRTHDS